MSKKLKSNRRARKSAASALTIENAQTTAWSHPTQTPAISGVYEIKPEYPTTHRMFAFWSGSTWYEEAQTPIGARAHYENGDVRAIQQVTWRGIIK